jgi:hypothetical protein
VRPAVGNNGVLIFEDVAGCLLVEAAKQQRKRHDLGAGRRRDRRPVRWREFIGLKVAVLDNLEQCPIEFRADPPQ